MFSGLLSPSPNSASPNSDSVIRYLILLRTVTFSGDMGTEAILIGLSRETGTVTFL